MLGVAAIDSNCSEKTITARGGKWIDDNSSTLAMVILPPRSAVRYIIMPRNTSLSGLSIIIVQIVTVNLTTCNCILSLYIRYLRIPD